MTFYLNPSKQTQEVNFSRKTKKIHPSPLTFSTSTASQNTSRKHLGGISDSSLSFDENLISVQSKTNKTIGLLRR